jgi:AsmA protein
MRKLGIAVLIVLVLIVVAALAVPYLIDVNRYRGRIQTELEQRLNRPVSLGEMRLSLLPLAFRVKNPVIAEGKNFGSGKPFAQADELGVSAQLLPLLRRQLEINSLELKRPRIELIRNRQGVWNFASLGQEPAVAAPSTRPAAPSRQPTAPQPQPQTQAQATKPLTLKDLKISDGQVAITDQQKAQARTVYDHIDLRLIDFAPDKPFMVEAAAHLPGQGKQEIKLDGKGGPVNKAAPASTPFKGTLELKQVSLSAFQKFVNSQALAGMEAIASGKADVNSDGERVQSNGSLRLEQARVRGVDIGYPITADYSLADDLNKNLLRIDKGNLKLGSTPVSISGTVNMQPTPAQLDVKVNASDVSIDEVARLAAAFGVAFNPNMKIVGRINADLRAQGSAKQPAMNGKLSASNLSITGKELPQAVQVQNIDLVMTPQEIRSNQFAAKTGNTMVTAQFALAQYTTPKSRVDANIRTANARLGEVLNIARAYGISAVDGVTGDGNLSLDVRAVGPLKNFAAMIFSGSGGLQNAQLKSPNITQPVKVNNANLRFSQNSAVLEKLAASIGQSNLNGTLTLKNFAAPQVQFAIGADKIVVAEWQKIFNTGSAQRAVISNFWQFVPQAKAATPSDSFVNRTTGNGTLNVGSIVYDDLVMNNVKANVRLDRGVIKLDPVTSELFGGQQVGSIVIDTRTTPLTYAVSSKLDRVDANKLLSSVSSLKQTLYGLLAANAQTRFSSPSSTEIVRTLNGRMSLNLSDGKLANVDLLYQLANIGKFVSTGKAISQKNFTSLTKLTGDFDVKNGVAQTNNLQAVTDAGTLAARGVANLVDQTLNMKVTAVLPKALSAQVGGTGVGGFMNTALANKNGELVMPVLITGSFQKPTIAPDLETIARMKIQNLLPTGANPGQLSSGILGSVLGGKSQPGQAGSLPQGDQNGVQGVLDRLRGKKPQQPPPSGNQPAAPNGATQQQPNATGQQQQPKNWSDVLQGVLNKKKQQQQQQQQQQPEQQQSQPPK